MNRSSSQERLVKLQREYKLLDYKLTAGHALTEEQQQRLIWLKEEIQWIDQRITERKMRKWS